MCQASLYSLCNMMLDTKPYKSTLCPHNEHNKNITMQEKKKSNSKEKKNFLNLHNYPNYSTVQSGNLQSPPKMSHFSLLICGCLVFFRNQRTAHRAQSYILGMPHHYVCLLVQYVRLAAFFTMFIMPDHVTDNARL